MLKTPPDKHLRFGFAVFLGNGGKHGIAESLAAAEGRPALHDKPVCRGIFGGFELIRVGKSEMELYLIHHRQDAAFAEKDV